MREYLLRRLLLLIPTLLGVTFIVFLMMRFINMRSVSFFKGTQSDYMGINDPHLRHWSTSGDAPWSPSSARRSARTSSVCWLSSSTE
jgi:ABC-type microcin C transport system permease subunit YejB